MTHLLCVARGRKPDKGPFRSGRTKWITEGDRVTGNGRRPDPICARSYRWNLCLQVAQILDVLRV
jgi:hypothetical protein